MDIQQYYKKPIDSIYIFKKRDNIFSGIIFVKEGIFKHGIFTFDLYLYEHDSHIIRLNEEIIHPSFNSNNEYIIPATCSLNTLLQGFKSLFDNKQIFNTKKDIIKNSKLFINEISKNIIYLSRAGLDTNFKLKISPFHDKPLKNLDRQKIIFKMEKFIKGYKNDQL